MTKTWTSFCSVVVFGARTKVAVDVFESFFWHLDVMLQPSWEILLDEAVKEGRNHKRGSTRMSGTPRLSARGGRAAGETKGETGESTFLATKQWTAFWSSTQDSGQTRDSTMLLFFDAKMYFSVKSTDIKNGKSCLQIHPSYNIIINSGQSRRDVTDWFVDCQFGASIWQFDPQHFVFSVPEVPEVTIFGQVGRAGEDPRRYAFVLNWSDWECQESNLSITSRPHPEDYPSLSSL